MVKADSLDYTVGDTVSHIKFGQGTVLEIQDGGRDFEVKVDFENMGSSACLHLLQNSKKSDIG